MEQEAAALQPDFGIGVALEKGYMPTDSSLLIISAPHIFSQSRIAKTYAVDSTDTGKGDGRYSDFFGHILEERGMTQKELAIRRDPQSKKRENKKNVKRMGTGGLRCTS